MIRQNINAQIYIAIFIMLALFLSMLALPANADQVTFAIEWNAPITRIDNTELPSSEILEYRIYHAIDNDVVVGDLYSRISDNSQSTLMFNLAPRTMPYSISFAVTAVTKLRDSEGNLVFDDMMKPVPDKESALSNIVTKNFFVYSNALPDAPARANVNITACDDCIIVEQ